MGMGRRATTRGGKKLGCFLLFVYLPCFVFSFYRQFIPRSINSCTHNNLENKKKKKQQEEWNKKRKWRRKRTSRMSEMQFKTSSNTSSFYPRFFRLLVRSFDTTRRFSLKTLIRENRPIVFPTITLLVLAVTTTDATIHGWLTVI